MDLFLFYKRPSALSCLLNLQILLADVSGVACCHMQTTPEGLALSRFSYSLTENRNKTLQKQKFNLKCSAVTFFSFYF